MGHPKIFLSEMKVQLQPQVPPLRCGMTNKRASNGNSNGKCNCNCRQLSVTDNGLQGYFPVKSLRLMVSPMSL